MMFAQKLEISQDEIRRMVSQFYDSVRKDLEIGPIFENAIQNNWDAHMITMQKFWTTLLLNVPAYKGYPLLVHKQLADLAPEHFERWLELFTETTNNLFEPMIALEIQEKARRIAASLSGVIFRAS